MYYVVTNQNKSQRISKYKSRAVKDYKKDSISASYIQPSVLYKNLTYNPCCNGNLPLRVFSYNN